MVFRRGVRWLVSWQHRAGGWTERTWIGFLLLLTVVGVCCEVTGNLAIAQGQLEWVASLPLFLVAVYGLPGGVVWMFTLRRKTGAWSRASVSLFAVVWYVLTLVPFAASLYLWPMRLSFAWEQASLEALARRIERGETPSLPLRLGFYTVTKAEKDSRGTAWLWISTGAQATHSRCVLVHCTTTDLPSDMVLFPRGLTGQLELADRWRCLWGDG